MQYMVILQIYLSKYFLWNISILLNTGDEAMENAGYYNEVSRLTYCKHIFIPNI